MGDPVSSPLAVVGIDGSEAGRAALRRAAGQAKRPCLPTTACGAGRNGLRGVVSPARQTQHGECCEGIRVPRRRGVGRRSDVECRIVCTGESWRTQFEDQGDGR